MNNKIFHHVRVKTKGLLPLCLLSLLPLLTGCSDFLETNSKSKLSTETSYSSAENIDQNLTGIYGCLKPFATDYFAMSEFRSDNM